MTLTPPPITDLRSLLNLEPVKPDAFMAWGPDLGVGRIYGGQVVAQALRAAALTVDDSYAPHSMHAYFVRAGDERQGVLYEVDRVRDGRSFCTRQVVAYQAGGAILNLIASFQAAEEGEDHQPRQAPEVPPLETVPDDNNWDLFFEAKLVRWAATPEPRGLAMMRVTEDLGDDRSMHACALAYLSDEYPLGIAIAPHSLGSQWDKMMTASLDHAIWFHRPVRVDQWLSFDLVGHGVGNARGFAQAAVFDAAGVHVATVAQEGLVRPRR